MKKSRMKFSFLNRPALAGWAEIMLFPLLFLTLSFCLLISAGKDYRTLLQEKNQPCELIVTGDTLTDADTAEIARLPSVLKISAVYTVPVTLHAGSIQLDTVLSGISSDYLNTQAAQGNLFPEQSGMPYLFLNQAALEELAAASDSPGSPEIMSYDWLNTSVSVSLSEEIYIICKICGVNFISDRTDGTVADSGRDDNSEDSVPQYYISISSAKELLVRSGAEAVPSEIRLCITDSGHEDEVVPKLEQMGYQVENSNPDTIADRKHREELIFHTLFSSLISLLASLALLRCRLKLDYSIHREEYRHLQWISGQTEAASENPCGNSIFSRISRIRISMLILISFLFSIMITLSMTFLL